MKNQLPQLKQNCFVLKNLTFAFLFAFLIFARQGWGQISIISLPYNPPVTNFNSYNPSSLANFTATIPTGWTGSSSLLAVYNGQGTGTSNVGGYWAYGTVGEFSLGALRSGTPGNITYSVSYVNNSGSTITAITLAWDYEQWRYANTSGWDCSGTGSLLGNATLNGKDFAGVASGTSGTVSVTGVASFTLSGLSIANGATFGISWLTTDITGADNGVAIDNFSLTAQTCQPLNVSISGNLSFCAGGSTTLDAGSGYALYNWSVGATTQTINVNTATTVTVTVTDGNGCTGSDSKTTTVNANPTPSITGSTSFCAGGSTTLDAGSGYALYNWSVGATTQTINVNTATTVTVTVTDGNGCTGSDSKTTTVNANPTPSITGSTSFCAGGSTTLNAGPGYSLYNWSTGATTQTINVNTATTVTVTVTDGNGCTGSDTKTTTINANLTPTITGSTSFCAGGSTTLDAGSGYALYNWSVGATTQTINVNTASTFTVTVTDANGCTGSASATTTVNPVPVVNVTGGGTFCGGSTTTLSATTGYSNYSWSRFGGVPITGTGPTLLVTQSGLYTVTVTNSFSCSSQTSTAVEIGDFIINGSLSAGSTSQANRLLVNGVVSTCAAPKACPGNSGAAGPFVYNLHTITNVNPNPVCATIALTANCGEFTFSTVYLGSFNPANNCTNYLADQGSAVTGGPWHYEVTIPGGATIVIKVNNFNSGLYCGNYRLVVDIPRVAAGITLSPPSPQCSGTPITLTASPANSYSWSPGAATTQAIVHNTGTTNYTVTLGYGNTGCTATASATAVINPLPTISTTGPLNLNNDPGLCSATVSNAQLMGQVTSVTGTPPPTVTFSPPAGSFPVGTTTVIATATNICGAPTSSFNVVVTDNQPPTAICQNIIVQLNPAGTATITPAQVNNGSTDNCGTVNLVSVSPNTFNCSNVNPVASSSIWINEIHYDNSGTDANEFIELAGNAGISLANYALVRYNGATPGAAVIYTTPAQITAMTGVIPNQSNGFGTFAVFFNVDGLQNGPNDGVALVNTATNTVVQLLSYEGVLTVAAGQGLASGMTSTNLPVSEAGALAGGSIRLAGTGTQYSGFTWQAEAAPASPGAINAGQSFPAPAGNTVTLTINDGNGNTSTCNAIVTVNDVTPPTVVCQNINLPLDATGNGTLTAAMVNNGSTDACGISTTSVSPNTFTCANIGGNTVTLTVTDINGNSATCTATVTVQDVTPPTANCQNLTVQLSAGGTASITAAQINNGSTDACGLSPTMTVSPSTFNCSDVTGDPVTDLFISEYIEGSSFNKAIEIYNGTGAAVNLAAGQYAIKIYSNGSVSASSTTNLTGTVAAGDVYVIANTTANAAILAQADQTSGNISFNGNDAVALVKGVSAVNVDIFGTIGHDPGTEWGSGLVSTADNTLVRKAAVTNGVTVNPPPGFPTLATQWDGFVTDNSANLGSHTINGGNLVTLTVNDLHGNSSTCTAYVTVQDLIVPTISCPAPITVNNTTGQCGAIVNYTAPVGTDNCTVPTVQTAGLPSGSFFPVGTTTNTFVVTDNSGNTASCSFNVIVNDNEDPNITCPPTVVVNTDAGVCYATNVSLGNPTTGDNCGGLLGIDNNLFDQYPSGQFPQGGIIIQWEVTDQSGNKASCNQTLAVVDNENPVALCKNICIYLGSNGLATITGADIDNGSTDNCGIASLTPSQTTFSFADAGPNTVTLTVLDVNGNSSTCTATVTVGEYYTLFGAGPTCSTPSGQPDACHVNIGNGNNVSGNVGSYRLVTTGGGVVINGKVHSGGKVNYANGVSSKSISAANLLGQSGNILSTGNAAQITGDVDVMGNIYINQNAGSFVTGTVRHPVGTTYSGPVPGGGVLLAPPVLPALPGMPTINAYSCGGANITTTATLNPGSYGNLILGNAAGVIITFNGPGNYYFSSIKMGQGGIHTFKYDFLGLPGKINIYVCGDIDFGTHYSQWANPNTPDACRVYFETHGTGSTNGTNSVMSAVIALGSQFYGRVWAPYGGIKIGSGSCCTYATGSFWSAKQVQLEGAVTINRCGSACPPGPRIGQDGTTVEETKDMLQVYPNPTTGQTTVSFFAETPYSYTLKVMDYQGRVVLSNESKAIAGDNTMEIDMGGFAKGLYMIEVGNAEHSQKVKVVVQ